MLCTPPPPQPPLQSSRRPRPLPLRAAPRCSKPNDAEPSPSPPSTAAGGGVRRQVLSPEGRAKLDPRPDRDFYALPRLVTHVDDGFIATLTGLYRERLRAGWDVLDLMSSWVSHLPPEVRFRRVVGHGLNAQELARNPRLDLFFVKDLNKEQRLELESGTFDAVLCTVSVQYLQSPEKVLTKFIFLPLQFLSTGIGMSALAIWHESGFRGDLPGAEARGRVHRQLQQPDVLREGHQRVAGRDRVQPRAARHAVLPVRGGVHAARGDQEAAVGRRIAVLAAGRRDEAVRRGRLRPVLRSYLVQELQANVTP